MIINKTFICNFYGYYLDHANALGLVISFKLYLILYRISNSVVFEYKITRHTFLKGYRNGVKTCFLCHKTFLTGSTKRKSVSNDFKLEFSLET